MQFALLISSSCILILSVAVASLPVTCDVIGSADGQELACTDDGVLSPHSVASGEKETWLSCEAIQQLEPATSGPAAKLVQKAKRYGVRFDYKLKPGFIAALPRPAGSNDPIQYVYVKRCRDAKHCKLFESALGHYKALRNHPNVVKTLGYCESTRTAVQELLIKISVNHRSEPASHKFQRAIDVAESLRALDSVGHLMCDLCPNQWVDTGESMKLLDLDGDNNRQCFKSFGSRYRQLVYTKDNDWHNFPDTQTVFKTSKRHVWMMPELTRVAFGNLVSLGKEHPQKAWLEEVLQQLARLCHTKRASPELTAAAMPTLDEVIAALVAFCEQVAAPGERCTSLVKNQRTLNGRLLPV